MRFLRRITPLVLMRATFCTMGAVAGAQLAIGNLSEAHAAGAAAIFLVGGFALGQADRDERARKRARDRRMHGGLTTSEATAALHRAIREYNQTHRAKR